MLLKGKGKLYERPFTYTKFGCLLLVNICKQLILPNQCLIQDLLTRETNVSTGKVAFSINCFMNSMYQSRISRLVLIQQNYQEI